MKDISLRMDDYLPLRDVVFNTLREAILTGELEPGERLMEIKLAEKLGKTLVGDGTRRDRGTAVKRNGLALFRIGRTAEINVGNYGANGIDLVCTGLRTRHESACFLIIRKLNVNVAPKLVRRDLGYRCDSASCASLVVKSLASDFVVAELGVDGTEADGSSD